MASDAKNVQYRLENDMIEDIKNVAKMTGKSMTDIVKAAVNRELSQFRNRSGRVKVIPAFWLSGVSDYDRKVAESEGREPVKERHGCYVIDEAIMYGEPYYSVYDNESGSVMQIQKTLVEFSKEIKS